MRILFGQGTPEPLRESLAGHSQTAFERGWSGLSNSAKALGMLVQQRSAVT